MLTSVMSSLGQMSNPDPTGGLLCTARLNGANEVPAVSTGAVGVAGFALSKNRDSLFIQASFNGLSGAIDGAHIHEGAAGTNGSVIFDLSAGISGNRIKIGIPISVAQRSKLLGGSYYLNIHTAANPNGEIRGQIKLETDKTFFCRLLGANEVPSVTTTAIGYARFNLSANDSIVEVNIAATNISGVNGAHIHYGGKTVNGAVAIALDSYKSGTSNTYSGTIKVSSLGADAKKFLDSLKAGRTYLNIHTSANPNGELRGQLAEKTGINFDSWIDGAQEVPSVSTNARGYMACTFNLAMDTLEYRGVVDGLSDTASSAHLHDAAAGANGGVLAMLSPTSFVNEFAGKIAASAVTGSFADFTTKILSGKLYANFHTDTHANGEARGQVYRVAYDGYMFDLCGNQEVPSANTSANGLGTISINRGKTLLHAMIVENGFASGSSNGGTHIHNAAPGANGGVILDLSSVFGSAFYGYTYAKIDNTVADFIKSGNSYVNTHTSAFADGEIRGQIIKMSICPNTSTGIAEASNGSYNLSIYPNPVQDRDVNLSINAERNSDANLLIYNSLGKLQLSKNISLSKGLNNENISLESFAKGIYIVRVVTNGKTIESTKLIMQ